MPNEQGVCPRCAGSAREYLSEVDLSNITEALDYIHGKVTAIWNKVK